MCLWYPAYIITSRPFIGITWITWMRKFDFYFFWFKINLRNHTNPIVVIMFTQNIWSYTNILNIGADIHFVSEEIKFTFKSISTWDTFQLDGRVRCWNILVITSSSWYYFSYRMLMFQFTASCIDFICFNTKFTLGIASLQNLNICSAVRIWPDVVFLQTSLCCHSFHSSSYLITGNLPWLVAKKFNSQSTEKSLAWKWML